MLYATDTGPLPESTLRAVAGAAFDVVLLEETFGRVTDHRTGHLDLATFPRELARLRQVGAVTATTDVIAVHLGHHNPPGPELDRVLADWGARTVPDLTRLELTEPEPDAEATARSLEPPAQRRTLLLGGARSGKSHEAERMLAAVPVVRYVATGGRREDDPEWTARIEVHRSRRPAGWTTVETSDVATELGRDDPSPVLVDCLSLWLADRLDLSGTWEHQPGTAQHAAALACVQAELDDLVRAIRDTRATIVLVSNEVGSGVVPEHSSGRLYRDLLGRLNARVAEECDDVALLVAGRVLRL
jgi:adenosylcobinamide kinase/adenosylcobinamide-phosphate guanylyltransferase